MDKIYHPNEIEYKIQKYWEHHKTFKSIINKKKKKYYCLAMLPYPSGKLHMGHVRNYTISDVLARFNRMKGNNVLHPIGWDAFGLPAEEAAIKNNIIPNVWTKNNIQSMKQQLKKLGFSYDWDREITTCNSDYYRWEQWFFKKLFYKKLIYKKISLVNWCPTDKTVLANEQVIHNQCWRCQSKIILKFQPQWFLKITKYSERLLHDLNLLKQWPEKVKTMQKNWIGKSSGFEIILNLFNKKKYIKIYITELSLLMKIKFISISPLHDLSQKILTIPEIEQFIQNNYTMQQNYYDYSKFQYLGKNTDQYAIHPITKKKIPIWITNYTELEYNIKVKAAIPEHNMYDLFFYKKYKIFMQNNDTITYSNYINYNNKNFSENIFKYLSKKKIIKEKNIYKLQDWGISRQRYWGTPIPIAYLKNNKIITIPNNKLPIILPNIKNMNDFKNIQNIYKKWSKIKIHHIFAKMEIDTFDTFIESSWYYIRYTSPNFQGMIDSNAVNYWLPIDQYIGGIEHATMHLIYFRCFNKILYDLKLIKNPEPAIKLLCQGMVLSDAFYYINQHGKKKWISPKEIKIIKNKKGQIKKIISNISENIIHAGMIKMSKSKNNGIDPEIMIKKYGADTIRLFIMFAAPVHSDIEWNESGVKGMYKFLQKIWNLVYYYKKNKNCSIRNHKDFNIQKIKSLLNTTILKVSHDIEHRQSFNTAISNIIKLTNNIYNIFIINDNNQNFLKNILNSIIKMLYPFTPHISFFLWKELNKTIIDHELWPEYNLKSIIDNELNLIVQINGKKKDIIIIKKNTTKKEILNILNKNSKISNILKINTIKKIIFIQNKLINIVI